MTSTTRLLDPAANLVKVSVSGTHNASTTTINLITGEAAKVPDPATTGAYNATWWSASAYPDPADDPNKEIVRVTAKSGNTLTVTRGQESITATAKSAKSSGYKLLIGLSKKMIDDINTKLRRSGSVIVGMDAGADYLCDGTADDVQIDAANQVANVDNGEWDVSLREGIYDITATLQKRRCNLRGSGRDSTKLAWSGAASGTMLTSGNDENGYVSEVTMDGGDKANGVVGFVPNANIANMVFERVIFKNLGTGIDTDGGANKQMWDSAAYNCEFESCTTGILFSEFQFNLYNPVFSGCTTGVKFEVNSNTQVHGGTFSGNGIDIQFTGHPENILFTGVWFEESTTGVFRCDVSSGFVKNLTFVGCRFSSASASDLFDFTNLEGNVTFLGCQFRETDLGGGSPSSTTVTEGTYSNVTFINCTKVDLAGALTQFGTNKVFGNAEFQGNLTLVNVINEISTDTGLSGNSDSAIPTEKAVKEYVDANAGGATTWAELDKTVSDIADITTRSHTSLTDIGTNTHAQLDSHVSNTSNPHSVTAAQLSALQNVVEDLTPQLGGDLDLNNKKIYNAGDINLEAQSGLVYQYYAGTDSQYRIYGSGGSTESITLKHDSAKGILSTETGGLLLSPKSGLTYSFTSGVNGSYRIYEGAGNDYMEFTHDGTNATISTSTGDLYLNSAGDNVICQDVFNANIINEVGTDTGVTIEGVLVKDSAITLVNAINEFSTDTGLSGNSDSAVPTEKAVKAYVDASGSGTGDVVGPASAVDSNFAAFDTTTGKLIKDSGSKTADFATAAHNHTGVYAPVLGADENYVTDAQLVVIGNTSGTNTGDNSANTSCIAKSIGEAKGDLIGFTASATPAKITVGTHGYVLTADTASASGISWAAGTSGTPTAITVANEATDTTCFPLFVTAVTGDLGPKTNAGLTFNSNTGNLGATIISTPALQTASGALTITPAAGSNLNISLATTGDFAVNTNMFYVDTSATRVGIGTATPACPVDFRVTDALTSSGTGEAFRFYSSNAAAIDVGPTLILGGATGNAVTTYAFGGLRACKQTTAGDADYKGYLAFYTTTNAGVFLERMRIDGSGTLALGTNSITMSGSLATTGARITKGWFTDLECTNSISINGTSIAATYAPKASPIFTTTFTLGSDTDVSCIIGRGKLGYNTVNGDYFCVSHFDMFNSTDAGFTQTSTGATVINAKTGTSVYLTVNQTSVFDISSTTATSRQNLVVAATKTLTVDSNGDTTHILGRGKLGYNATDADCFAISHFDQMSSTNYGFMQTAAGLTILNCVSGQSTQLRYANDPVLTIGDQTVTQGGLIYKKYSGTLADDATITLPTGVAGFIEVWDGTNFGKWSVKTDGTCTLAYSEGSCDDADTDTFLCVYDGGTGAVIKNRTGGSVTIRYIYNYS